MPNFWLSAFSRCLVAATFVLIFAGALVTSMGAGLAVPDWPTTFGYNMFLYPISRWQGGVFYEHTHRLIASLIGLMTVVLAIGIWKTDGRSWVRKLGWFALALVIVQGIFGGLRVTKLSIILAMIHGCVAQAFLCVVIVLAVALSARWRDDSAWFSSSRSIRAIRAQAWTFVGAVYVQLILGAVMRHLGAGLAIADFPLAFGKLIPPIHSLAVGIHFAHRAGAVVVSLTAIILIITVIARAADEPRLLRPALLIGGLTAFQISLGAHIIWLMRPPLTTTLHVVNGAAILGTALLLALRASRFQELHASEGNEDYAASSPSFSSVNNGSRSPTSAA